MKEQQFAVKRIHIIGSIGSGKTTLARKLSKQYGLPHYELDNVVWIRSDKGDIKRTEEERDAVLSDILIRKSWIIEGAHHKWVAPSFQRADVIIFLDTRLSTRRFRIIKRFIKQKFKVEKVNYRPTFKVLKFLYQYNTIFDNTSKQEIMAMLVPFESKLIILNSSNDMPSLLKPNVTEKNVNN